MHAGETFDARLEMPGWDQPGFNDRQWDSVDTGSKIDALLQSYPGDPIRRTGELSVAKLTQPHEGLQVFDLGQNFSGWVRLKVSGNAGDKVTMRFGEMLNPDGSVFMDNLRSARATDTYILKGDGEEVYEPHFTFHGFRYVEVEGLPNKPPADTITGVVIHTDAPMTSSFECSDPMLNRLHQNILWGQRSNYLEVPTDCPQRDERLGWTGDTQVFIRSGTYHQDIAAFFTKWMVDLADSRNPAGIYGNQAPVFHGWGSPGWSDAGVICPWTIYQAYGDKRILETHYDEMKQYIKACGRNDMGGLGNGFGDWLSIGAATPKNLISVAYYAYSTRLMAQIATTLGKTEDAKQFESLFEQLREHFQKTFVDSDGKIKGHTQTAYCMALTYNLLTDKQRRQAADHLVERIESNDNHLSVGFLGVSILLPTLTEIGRSDLAYQLIQNKTYPSWGYSVQQGATTIWERWNSWTKDKGFNAGAMNSFNHYAYGACSEWMFASMLGIDMASPGYQSIQLKPEVGHGVTWAKGHYDSIHGRIASDWTIDSGTFRWKVTVPPNTTATLSLPTATVASIKESNQPIGRSAGITAQATRDERVQLQVGSGTYVFTVKGVR
jgi:alpha-L-rhamnosidase